MRNSLPAVRNENDLKAMVAGYNRVDIQGPMPFSGVVNGYYAGGARKAVVTGESPDDRFAAVCAFIDEAFKTRMPVIVLYNGNEHLVKRFGGRHAAIVWSAPTGTRVCTKYKPLEWHRRNYQAEILTKLSDMTAAGHFGTYELWQSVIELIGEAKTDGNVSLADLVEFPFLDVDGFIDGLKKDAGRKDRRRRLRSRVEQNPAVAEAGRLCNKLRLLTSGSGPTIGGVFEYNLVVCVDLSRCEDPGLTQEFLLLEIKKAAMIKRRPCLIVADGLRLLNKDGSEFDRLMKSKDNLISTVISAGNLSDMCGGDEADFKGITSTEDTDVFVFRQSNKNAAFPWEDYFGERSYANLRFSLSQSQLARDIREKLGSSWFEDKLFKKLAGFVDAVTVSRNFDVTEEQRPKFLSDQLTSIPRSYAIARIASDENPLYFLQLDNPLTAKQPSIRASVRTQHMPIRRAANE
jgi:hypothetical protein